MSTTETTYTTYTCKECGRAFDALASGPYFRGPAEMCSECETIESNRIARRTMLEMDARRHEVEDMYRGIDREMED